MVYGAKAFGIIKAMASTAWFSFIVRFTAHSKNGRSLGQDFIKTLITKKREKGLTSKVQFEYLEFLGPQARIMISMQFHTNIGQTVLLKVTGRPDLPIITPACQTRVNNPMKDV